MNVRQYALVTAAYWAFTVTDGALRMLVLLHFHDLGYGPVALAFLFLLYEFFGVITNFVGGRLGARHGLNRTLYAGLALQVIALLLLVAQDPAWTEAVSVVWVMGAQALSGIAKDLTKMSAKSAVKVLVADGDDHHGRLFTVVAALTGSKNALKGVGFFVGGALLAWVGFDAALVAMALVLAAVLLAVGVLLRVDIGKSPASSRRPGVLSDNPAINRLAAARLFLFASRDIWFVVALPVYLAEELDWSFEGIGAFLAAWVIGYGIVQSGAPQVLRRLGTDTVVAARQWAAGLGIVAALIALSLTFDIATDVAVVGGLIQFGVVFAVNSSVHSFLILAYTDADDVAVNVGFYYSANAAGRLVGTLVSGVAYLVGGLSVALWTTTAAIAVTTALSVGLPPLATAAGEARTNSASPPTR